MKEHVQRETNKTILAGLRIIEFGNSGIDEIAVMSLAPLQACIFAFFALLTSHATLAVTLSPS